MNMEKLPAHPTDVHNEVDRELASRVLYRLGNAVGHRETSILTDRDVQARRDGAYPGCWRFSADGRSMLYRKGDNTIVG